MANIFVEVMYSDRDFTGKFVQRRAHIGEARTLPTDNALFVIISFETSEVRSRRVICGKHYERGFEAYGHDFTGLIVRQDKSTLVEWDEMDFRWFHHDDPRGEYPQIDIPPVYPGDMIRFVGVLLPDNEWREAVNQFEQEMH